MKRRDFIKGSLLGALLPAALAQASPSAGAATDPAARLAALERRHGGRLGVAILDTGNGRRAACRGDERFLMCSTFKVLAVAAVLARVAHRVRPRRTAQPCARDPAARRSAGHAPG